MLSSIAAAAFLNEKEFYEACNETEDLKAVRPFLPKYFGTVDVLLDNKC